MRGCPLMRDIRLAWGESTSYAGRRRDYLWPEGLLWASWLYRLPDQPDNALRPVGNMAGQSAWGLERGGCQRQRRAGSRETIVATKCIERLGVTTEDANFANRSLIGATNDADIARGNAADTDEPADEGDTAQEIISMQENQTQIDLLRTTLAQIDKALARVADGTYGLSEVSGKPIPIERLEALPYATTLVDEEAPPA